MFHARRSAEDVGIGEREGVAKRLDRSAQCLFEENLLRFDQAMLVARGRQRAFERRAVAGLAQEAKNISVIDRADGVAEIRLPGQENANDARILLADFCEQNGAAHLRHPHVRRYRRKIRLRFEESERGCTRGRGANGKSRPEIARDRFE